MNNPVNDYKMKLALVISKGRIEEQKHEKLLEKHELLVADSVDVENDRDACREAITEMCDGCVVKGRAGCQVCSLHHVAIQQELWEEPEDASAD